ncbi:MAG: alkaline phosphatase, partial [Gammaproteobacteria bacterium]|nr:alkaline phosphatase [Gammaproteobacteria bacterium]
MLGEAQERRLTESIANNRTAWNVIASTSVFSPFHLDIDNKTFNFTGSWDGYPANRDRVVEAIRRSYTGQAVI